MDHSAPDHTGQGPGSTTILADSDKNATDHKTAIHGYNSEQYEQNDLHQLARAGRVDLLVFSLLHTHKHACVDSHVHACMHLSRSMHACISHPLASSTLLVQVELIGKVHAYSFYLFATIV